MTKTDFDTKYSPIIMPEPFAGSGSKSLPANTQDDKSGFSYPLGFNDAYSSPNSNNGKFVTRKQMNAIGNLATHNDFHRRCGGLNTFDPAFAALIGGYPKGAVLSFVRDRQLYYVQSLIDNNTVDFRAGVDEISWSLINSDHPADMTALTFFEVSNLGASSTFVLGGTVARASGLINIEEALTQTTVGVNSFTYDFASGKYGFLRMNSGVMIKDITSGDDGKMPQFNIGDIESSSGNIDSASLTPNGWSSLIGNPGWLWYKDTDFRHQYYSSFSGRVESGHTYKLLVYCGNSVEVDQTAYKINATGIGLTGALKLVYAN